jgi:hypothetical protein
MGDRDEEGFMAQHKGRRWISGRAVAIGGCASLLGSFALAAPAAPGLAATRAPAAHPAFHVIATNGCQLGNGVKHVIQLTFDNVHFFRDNPNVPSDLEMMPNLLNFFENNGTFLSNNHTPLIAHTAIDILTTLTGLYGDRQGMPGMNNAYRTYNPDGTTDPASAFAYWTDPVFDTATPPTTGHDTNPSMVYSPTPPATTNPPPQPNTITPAPWAPYTRAGCDAGYVGTANVELENTAVDIPKVFGPNSPEAQQLAADPDGFKDAEVADYVGVAVHCAQGSALCADAQGVKFGQTTPSPTASPDLLPNEPGGYNNFQGLFGHRYVAPQIGAGTPNVTHNGFEVTNGAGNLVDLNGNELDGAFLNPPAPGFPGFSSINASQTLAYLADMQEAGVPITSGYISDVHGNEHIPALSGSGSPCFKAPAALPPGSACYIAQAQYYNQAFGTFFQRLAADGITPANTLFILSSDEGDHVAGANVGRAIQPTPANCDGATVSGDTVTPDVLCTYPTQPDGTLSFGELSGNLTGLLAAEKKDTTPFTAVSDSAPGLYVTGNPGPNDSSVRALERDTGGLTAASPYTGTTQPITNYLADRTEEAVLHMVNADPARTPTFTMFARPDYFLSTTLPVCTTAASCVTQNPGFAYNHGDYAAEIDTNFLGLAGPGVANLGLDGTAANAGPNSAGPDSGQVTVPGSGTTGTWLDETDIRPTVMYLLGLKDDYEHDGRVVTQILTHPNAALSGPGVSALGDCYKQLNSSVGEFGTATLQAATTAIESNSPGDRQYLATDRALAGLDVGRDRLAAVIKNDLEAAAFQNAPVRGSVGLTAACHVLIGLAEHLGAGH